MSDQRPEATADEPIGLATEAWTTVSRELDSTCELL
jgi:hypothetical protein